MVYKRFASSENVIRSKRFKSIFEIIFLEITETGKVLIYILGKHHILKLIFVVVLFLVS